ncbi:MAG: helix-turn-helix transcriptional regulator [Rhodothermales bacterium]|nr:helix-turn-helix transcriptional regulator [Rhodothermales bacterium]MBO6780596.1 helix-turn-helix transcriptional regulator [Rhodothermales bacterium]
MTLGAFEELVLLAVCGLRDGAYAVPIQQEITERGKREASMGSVYATLDRLEKKGLLRSRMGPSLGRPGGKARRFYEPTGTGLAALSTTRASREGLVARLTPEMAGRLGYSL